VKIHKGSRGIGEVQEIQLREKIIDYNPIKYSRAEKSRQQFPNLKLQTLRKVTHLALGLPQ